MILVFGGTSEGRKVLSTLDKAGTPFFYSTKTGLQDIESENATQLAGGLSLEEMETFCKRNGIRVLIDASHPFATELHANVAECGRRLSLPVVRYERTYPERDKRLIWCSDFNDAVKRMESDGIHCLLALTGVQTIGKLRPFWKGHDCYFRILDREDSLRKAEEAGFPKERLFFYGPDSNIQTKATETGADAMLTKESGLTGGFAEKVEESLKCGLKVYVVGRPSIPQASATVSGEYGLRRAVERFCPGFYSLRSGFTTGSCATAASKAALLTLTEGVIPRKVSFHIPDGEELEMEVECVTVIDATTAEATVVKDAGDDPDVTDGCRIVARVSLAEHGEVVFIGGEGVGRVALPGIGLEVGAPAINPVPREMIRRELLAIYPRGCELTVSVPGGGEIAGKTFNSRIGVEGGISIIGTSGIVIPFSHEAFMEAIRREMEVAETMGCREIVLNSGAKSEKYLKRMFQGLPESAFIHYGNAIGETLEMASRMRFRKVTVGVMIGKAVKLAEGNTDTHSRNVTVNRKFLADLAKEAGCSEDAEMAVMGIKMARELWTGLGAEDSERFFPRLAGICRDVCLRCFPEGELTLMLVGDDGHIVISSGESATDLRNVKR